MKHHRLGLMAALLKHRRLLGMAAALFFALSVSCAMRNGPYRTVAYSALEHGVKATLVVACIDVRAAVALIEKVVMDFTNTYIGGLALRDRIARWLLLAMVLAEALRAVGDLEEHLRRMRAAAAWRRDTGHEEGRPKTDRFREWAALTVVCSIAVVPVLYYVAHAALA